MDLTATLALSLAVMFPGILRPPDPTITMLFAAAKFGRLDNLSRGANAASVKTSSQRFTLTIVAQGVRNSGGAVGVLVFKSALGWHEQVSAALRKKPAPANPGETEITVSDLPTGDYPVVVLHDENENEKLDRGPLGIPIERWGMSNNPSYLLSPPSFDAVRFRLTRSERLYVQLH